jgi:hypothetical protein
LLSGIIIFAVTIVSFSFGIRGEVIVIQNALLGRFNHVAIIVIAEEIIAALIDGVNGIL